MNNLFVCKNVTKTVGNYKIEDINFELKPGYILGIIGRNGSGKTTLLRTLMGSYKFDKNLLKSKVKNDKVNQDSDVLINNISIIEDVKAYKENMAYVFCETPFNKALTSIDNGKVYGRYYKTFDMDKYLKLLEEFDVPAKSKIGKLSKGQSIKQQLAFALSYDAKVYFFDEPTGNLDIQFRDLFYKYVREIVADGDKSVIYASHLVEEMEEFADYILWLKNENEVGKVKFYGDIDTLRNNYLLVEATEVVLDTIPKDIIVAGRKRENHSEMLIKITDEKNSGVKTTQEQKNDNKISNEIKENSRYASLKEIMYYEEKGEIL